MKTDLAAPPVATSAPPPAVPGVHAQPTPQPGPLDHPLHTRSALTVFALLVALPFVAQALGEEFYIGLASRILIYALAATSLNLVLGFGGLVSFGHAAFIGIGAYGIGILMQSGIANAWVAWPLAIGASALFALVVGAVSLRTRGVYFIMITLAFAQMVYYLMVSLKAYGGEDGMSLPGRSRLGAGIDLSNDLHFYAIALFAFAAAFLLIQRLLNAPFGHTLQAIRENETRMVALGYPAYRYQLTAFVIAGALAGLAGVLVANQGSFVSPALMQWNQSGMLMIMVILGGVGQLYGGFVGALVFLVLEEVLSSHTVYWQFGVGAVLLAVVLLAPNGLMSLVARKQVRRM